MSALVTPTGVLLGTWDVESPEWLAARGNALGGSDIAAVLGLSKRDSPFALWHRKAGRVGDKVQNTDMRAGRFLEDGICASFADQHPEYHVDKTGTFRHAGRPWQIANPDRLLTPKTVCGSCDAGLPMDCACPDPSAILETKLALYADEWGTEGTDEIPPYYLAQCRWYIDVLGIDTCYVHVFIASALDFRTYVVQSDAADQKYMRDKGRAFLDSIEAGERPPIDGHTETYQTVRKLHPDIEDVKVEIDGSLAGHYRHSLILAEAAKTQASEASARVLDAIGSGRQAIYNGDVIARRQAKQGGTPYLVAARGLAKETT